MSMIPHKRCIHLFHGDKLWIDAEWKDLLAAIGIRQGKDWSRLSSDAKVSGSFHTTNNYRIALKNGQAVFFKRYVYRRFRLKYWLQPSKAAIEAAGYHDLNEIGIDTLHPVAYGEKRRFGLLRASFIATLEVPDTIELGHYLARKWVKLPYHEKKQAIDKIQPRLVSQLQAAHAAGFFHWDLKLRNILIQDIKNDARLIWIDCPRSRNKAPFDRQGVLNDLASMARVGVRILTPGQRLRFLLDYCHGNMSHAKQLYLEIADIQKQKPPRPYWQLLPTDDPVFQAEKQKQGKSA